MANPFTRQASPSTPTRTSSKLKPHGEAFVKSFPTKAHILSSLCTPNIYSSIYHPQSASPSILCKLQHITLMNWTKHSFFHDPESVFPKREIQKQFSTSELCVLRQFSLRNRSFNKYLSLSMCQVLCQVLGIKNKKYMIMELNLLGEQTKVSQPCNHTTTLIFTNITLIQDFTHLFSTNIMDYYNWYLCF